MPHPVKRVLSDKATPTKEVGVKSYTLRKEGQERKEDKAKP
jgi:hypothetical protein